MRDRTLAEDLLQTTFLSFVRARGRYVTTTGEIRILGKNIYDPDISLIELRKAVGMVFQRPNPLPISIYENVVFGLRIHGEHFLRLCFARNAEQLEAAVGRVAAVISGHK